MAQSAVTVRIDSEMKSQFDELCEQFGMSANTAFNIFVKAVIRSRSIPFTIRGARMAQPSALDLFMEQRKAAEASQEPEMTLDEINAEIRAVREERQQVLSGESVPKGRAGDGTSGMRRKKKQTV